MSKLFIARRYGQIPIEILNNPKLSLKAKGLWVYMQSKPDGWRFSIERISKQMKEGKSAIREAIRELEKHRLLTRVALKDEKGKWNGYNHILYEKPLSENRMSDKRMSENYDTLSNKEYSNKDIVKKKKELSRGAHNNALTNPTHHPFVDTSSFGNDIPTSGISTSLEGSTKTSSTEIEKISYCKTKGYPIVRQRDTLEYDKGTNTTEATISSTATLHEDIDSSSSLSQHRKKKTTDYTSEVKQVIDHLNSMTGKKFKYTTKATQRYIIARLAEGFTVDELKQVIDVKTQQWLRDPEMKRFLRPETLFAASHCDSYLNEAKDMEHRALNIDEVAL